MPQPVQDYCNANGSMVARIDQIQAQVLGFIGDVQATVALPQVKRIFVTTGVYSGNLGGWPGAVDKCQAEAAKKNLIGRYYPWLSDAQGRSPATNFQFAGYPYVLFKEASAVSSNEVAASGAKLVSGTLERPLNLDINGNDLTANAWTNTKADGTVSSVSDHCLNWTSDSSTNYAGSIGDTQQTDSRWTEMTGMFDCSVMRHLYCVEQ
jgi:hypothetical protein